MDIGVPMAILDFVPVILFFVGALRLGLDLLKQMNAPAKVLYFSGAAMIVCAGFFKALYKLLFAAAELDIGWMTRQFFSNQAVGFLLAGVGAMMTLRKAGSKEGKQLAILPTGALVGMVIVGMAAMYSAFCRHASRLGKTSAIATLVISFFLSLCMGYLSSKDFDSVSMNLTAQAVNTCAMVLFFISSRILHKAGLGKAQDTD